MSKMRQAERIRIDTLIERYKTTNEKIAFLDGYQACAEKEKAFLEEEKRKMERENE